MAGGGAAGFTAGRALCPERGGDGVVVIEKRRIAIQAAGGLANLQAAEIVEIAAAIGDADGVVAGGVGVFERYGGAGEFGGGSAYPV